MIRVISNFMSSMSTITKKEHIISTVENVFKSIEDETIPTLEDMLSKDLNVINESQLVNNMRALLDKRTKDNMELFEEVLDFFKEVQKDEKKIIKLVEKHIGDYITNKSATAKDIAIMKFVTDVASFNYYVMDLCYYVLITDETSIPKIRLNQIRENNSSFISVMNSYRGNVNKLVKDLERVAEVTIADKEDKPESMVDSLLESQGKLVSLANVKGFINNPIYHIRMWLVDREIQKYEALKDKKKLIELKLLELKLEEQNESNPKLKSQIEYYEDKISGIEYDISQIED